MDVIKVCFQQELEANSKLIEKASNELLRIGYNVHIQTICNIPYLCWLNGLGIMNWKWILDIFITEGTAKEEYTKIIKPVLEKEILKKSLHNTDVYIASQINYKKPLDGAELITSCYLWNYETPTNERNNKMLEHFEMEKEQVHYDYIAFQCVKERLYNSSPLFDFFFESHISNPNGINEIYSKPALEEMRSHSRIFIDTNSRLLSFGHVRVK